MLFLTFTVIDQKPHMYPRHCVRLSRSMRQGRGLWLLYRVLSHDSLPNPGLVAEDNGHETKQRCHIY